MAIGQSDRNAEFKEKLRAESANGARRLSIASGRRGSAGEIQSQRFQTQDQISEREQARVELQRKAQSGPLGRLDHAAGLDLFFKGLFGYKPEGALAIEENEAEIARFKTKERNEEKLGRKKFEDGEGGMALAIARDKGEHSVEGKRADRTHRQELSWLQEYKRMRAQNASDEQAAVAGNLAVKEQQFQLAQRAASGLINARSGAGDIARAASIANLTS